MNTQYTQSNFLFETPVPSGEIIVSRTNLQGEITYANEVFSHISGYSADELLGKTHNILRHPDMPSSIFKELWASLHAHKIWTGHIKNLRKDLGYYWVKATISFVYKDDVLVEYKSIREAISQEEKQKYQTLYDQMKEQAHDKPRKIIYE